MTARVELRDFIQSDLHRIDGFLSWRSDAPVDLANSLLAAGYVKPRTITTVRELHALSTDTVIRTAFGAVFVKDGGWWAETGSRDKCLSGDLDLPATVLYEPQP